ncbi:MAG: class I mannose-6-phosphate isomerase [Oscillospiraceae bacterium]|nr:class I mannose-6-phosphate isomerase [Oscillospiraceae bacterium]
MSVFKLSSLCKDYIWGGERLRREFGKSSGADKIAESWELCCREDGQSVIENGEFTGKTLGELIEANGKAAVLGTESAHFDDFPVFIKLIDAADDLSVQVHPPDDYARKHEGERGKNELWYVVDADDGAELIYGFKREISHEEFAERIENGTLLEVTNSVTVKKGDVFFIESGTLHSIGKGILIAEIQQNSNTTYRVYDYGRLGNDGKPRELHIEKALDVTKRVPPRRSAEEQGSPQRLESGILTTLCECEYFTVKKLEFNGEVSLEADRRSFNSLLILDGEVKISSASGGVPASKGDSVFITAGTGKYEISGKGLIIITNI